MGNMSHPDRHKPQDVLIDGEPTGGETLTVSVAGNAVELVVRKGWSIETIAMELASTINQRMGATANYSAGAIAGGIRIWSRHGWHPAVSASSDSPSVRVRAVA